MNLMVLMMTMTMTTCSSRRKTDIIGISRSRRELVDAGDMIMRL